MAKDHDPSDLPAGEPPASRAEPEAKAGPEVKAGPEAKAGPEVKAGPEAKAVPAAAAEPEAKAEPEAAAEPEAEAESATAAEPEAEAEPEAKAEPEAAVEPAAAAEPKAKGGAAAAAAAATAAAEPEEARGFLEAVGAWRRRRKQKREGRYLLREVRRILKSPKRRILVPKAVVEEIEGAVAALREGMRTRPWPEERVGTALEQVEDLVDTHLAFARKSTLREYAEAIGMAALVAILLRFFIIQPFKIPSGSMIPTLQVGDHIFVNKFSYGLRVPFTKNPPRHFITWGEPHRGEVVVFIHKQKPEQDFIKRVIGVGGDRIKVEKGQISLQRGGKGAWAKVPRRFMQGACSHMDKHEADNTWYRVDNCTRYEETLGDHRYTTVYVSTIHGAMRDYPPLDDFKRTAVPVGFGFEPADEVIDPYRVPSEHIFVMGDNRRNSTDSRDLGEVGFIPREYIKGRAMLVWSSWGPDSFRWSRIGTRIR